MDEWIAALCAELGVDLEVDQTLLLDVARDAARAVARPAAPVSTFLVGYAAAQAGGGPAAVARAAAAVQRVAEGWPAPGDVAE